MGSTLSRDTNSLPFALTSTLFSSIPQQRPPAAPEVLQTHLNSITTATKTRDLCRSDSGFAVRNSIRLEDWVKIQTTTDSLANFNSNSTITEESIDTWKWDPIHLVPLLKPNKLSILPFGSIKDLQSIGLCSRSIVTLSPNLAILTNTTTLQLCCNKLTSLPAEIGYMKNLYYLSVTKNRLTSLPPTLGLLTKLVELKASNNNLVTLPKEIGNLKNLMYLSLDQNAITSIPSTLAKCTKLIALNLSQNQLHHLPAELLRLKHLRRIWVDQNPIDVNPPTEMKSSPPSLKELAARTVIIAEAPLSIELPSLLRSYLSSSYPCSFCASPYIDTFLCRYKIVQRNDTKISYEFRNCRRHWDTEDERIRAMFTRPAPFSPIQKAPRPNISPAPIKSQKSFRVIKTTLAFS